MKLGSTTPEFILAAAEPVRKLQLLKTTVLAEATRLLPANEK
jgi:hypothetical protein